MVVFAGGLEWNVSFFYILFLQSSFSSAVAVKSINWKDDIRVNNLFLYLEIAKVTLESFQLNTARISRGDQILPVLYSEASASVSAFGWMQKKSLNQQKNILQQLTLSQV